MKWYWSPPAAPAIDRYATQRALAPRLLAEHPPRRHRRVLVGVLVLLALILACLFIPRAAEEYLWHNAQVVRRLEYWNRMPSLPLQQRVSTPDPVMMDYIHISSSRAGWNERSKAYIPDAGFRRDLDAAIAALPAAVRRAADDKVAGIMLVQYGNFSGMALSINDEHGVPVKGFIVVDAYDFAEGGANEWLTWKENEPFESGVRWKLSAQIERPGENTRARALEFLLLHEIGHILVNGTDIGPPSQETADQHLPALDAYPFSRLSWRNTPDNAIEFLRERDFAMRHLVYYHWRPMLNSNTMDPIYRDLQRTNFATLYAATNPWDDFAEAFATYVHTQLQHRPYEITISHDDKTTLVYRSCWEEKRCEEKREYVERVLGISPGAGSN
ncbi:MAG: hypothetical protein JWN73_336 [Betaproteobacteria bacterium]|nr:hypothetical protein [Betaproteobacteria bacterium]